MTPVMSSCSLAAIAASVSRLNCLERNRVRAGDWVVVRTCNSTYCLCAQDDGSFLVSGGWFARTSPHPQNVRVNGCTWGGRIIKVDIVAAVGLCLEFGNRVTTSPIVKILVIQRERQN